MPTPSRTPPDPAPHWQVEASRYALLRRLAFAMRHEMVVHLQPIGMVAELMDRRLRATEPDLPQLQESLAKIHTLSRAASRSCLDVITWMAPVAGTLIPVDEGVRECLAQLRGNFSFRGFTLTEELAAGPTLVARAGLRHVLPAALLALTDTAQAPAEVQVRTTFTATQAVLSLRISATEGTADFAGETPYRLLQWSEVEALAAAEGIAIAREGATAQLYLPRGADVQPVPAGAGR